MALDSNEHLLYDLSHECKSQFNEILRTVHQKYPEFLIVDICTDFQLRFCIWTTYFGVFA